MNFTWAVNARMFMKYEGNCSGKPDYEKERPGSAVLFFLVYVYGDLWYNSPVKSQNTGAF